MAQREWVEKDFYKELGVSSDASADEIKRGVPQAGAATCIRTQTPTTRPPRRFKAVSEAHSVLVGSGQAQGVRRNPPAVRRRRIRAAAGATAAATSAASVSAVTAPSSTSTTCSTRPAAAAAPTSATCSAGCSDAAHSARPSRPRRGNDLETETELDFMEATKGVAMPLRLTSPAPCTNCHGSGARPGTSPKVCPTCNGSGVINRNQGAFGFSEPCTDCRGSGSIIEHPCDECKGTGVTTRTRTINVRIPPGVEDGQRIRLAGQGEAGLRGAPSGDLYVTVHVRPDKVFGRDGDDLTVTVPVSFSELALGTTLSVPTLDGKVGVRVPKGTTDGRILRVRGRGVPKRSGGQRRPAGHRQGRGPAEPGGRRARKRWRPTRWPSGPVGSTRGPDGQVIADGQRKTKPAPF